MHQWTPQDSLSPQPPQRPAIGGMVITVELEALSADLPEQRAQEGRDPPFDRLRIRPAY